MKLKDLIENIEVISKNVSDDLEISDIAYSSNTCTRGCAFVAIAGVKTDGHKFIKNALENGAVLVVATQEQGEDVPFILVKDTRKALAIMSGNFFGNPSKKFSLIGVTGTNGKTSTTYMLKKILEETGKKVGLIGTNNNMIGDRVIHSDRTTPESRELQELFAEMAKEGVDAVVMEVSSHALALDRTYGSAFNLGIFTNLTQDHLDFHENMEEYLKAKAILFSNCTVGVINLDDESSEYILKNSTSKNFTFSLTKNEADAIAKNVRLSSESVDFDLLAKGILERIHLNIPGRFSAYNALGAITASLAMGIEISKIKSAVAKIEGVKGRIEVVKTNTPYTVIIDYAHTPDGVKNVINSVRDFAKGRVITLIGCGGDRDKTKRPIMGKIATELSDFTIITSDNPRTEEPEGIINDILQGVKEGKAKYKVVVNREEAIAYGISIAKEGDVLILAGKGHETYQILKDKTIHFDEREIVLSLLESRKDVQG